MTNELEKQFFDTFGIEPKILNGCKFERCLNINKGVMNCIKEECPYYYKDKVEYPQITDSILLELICIDNQENVYKCRPLANNIEELKTYILEEFIRLYELGLFKRIHQIRTLFEEV